MPACFGRFSDISQYHAKFSKERNICTFEVTNIFLSKILVLVVNQSPKGCHKILEEIDE
jgi:hypothetical protein